MNFIPQNYQSLCSPAKFYVTISVVTLAFLIIQNIISNRKGNKFCIGQYDSCFHATFFNIFMFLLLKLIYIVFWTTVLNYVCRTGNATVSWIFVLFPLILFFVLLTGITLGPFFIYP